MKRRALLLALGTALATLPGVAAMPQAHAATFAIAFTGKASLPAFPCPSGCGGTFTGNATGTPSGPMNLSYFYTEPSATCPAQGTASGSGSIGSTPVSFHWTRVGLTAVLTVNVGGTAGAAVAVFVPSSRACNGAARTATVAGAGAG